MNPACYQQTYDVLYEDKDYLREAEIAVGLAAPPVHSLLDVGCGTGKHAHAFAAMGKQVTGIDIDPEMIVVAKSSADKDLEFPPRFLLGSAGDAPPGPFDFAVSLFNVVNYLTVEPDLIQFFQAIHDRLRPQGVFVFDVWNGLAAMLDPPVQKSKSVTRGDETYICNTTPQMDLRQEIATLDVEINVKHGDELVSQINHQFVHRLWTPATLRGLLMHVGFNVPQVATWEQPDRPANESDWKLLFIAERS